MKKSRLDEIGNWSEVKLAIIKEYASAYTAIMAARSSPQFTYVYIDAFAGAGRHISRRTGKFIQGTPLNALHVKNLFHEYHFVDLDDQKIDELESLAGERRDVFIYHGDCNEILPSQIFPRVKYEQFRRALCILDPYGLHLDWNILETAGRMKSVEIFLNFPIMDINMNVLKRDQHKVKTKQIFRMNAFWGDESWRKIAYVESSQMPLFGDIAIEKTTNQALVEGFRKRLIKVAGFEYVPEPMPMRNKNNAVVYYLFFASHKPVADKIVTEIFSKYREG